MPSDDDTPTESWPVLTRFFSWGDEEPAPYLPRPVEPARWDAAHRPTLEPRLSHLFEAADGPGPVIDCPGRRLVIFRWVYKTFGSPAFEVGQLSEVGIDNVAEG